MALLQHLTKSNHGPTSSKTKNDLLTMVLYAEPKLRNGAETNVYFAVEEHDVNGTKKRRIRARITVADATQYADHRPPSTASPALSNEEYNRLVALVNEDGIDIEDEEPEPKPSVNKSTEPSDTIVSDPNTDSDQASKIDDATIGVHENYIKLMDKVLNTLTAKQTAPEQSRISKLTSINPKHLRFDPEDGIGQFLLRVETAAKAHSITEDTDVIQMAISSLSSSTKGFELLGLCGHADFSDWSKFKDKLFLMQSANQDVYSKKFKNYQRANGQHAGSLMSNLKDLYCKSHGFINESQLDNRDLQTITEKFFDCLESNLAGLGKQLFSERNRDPNVPLLDSIVKLVVELEQNFDLGINRQTASYLDNNFNVNQNQSAPAQNITNEIADMKALINSLSSELDKISGSKVPSKTGLCFDFKHQGVCYRQNCKFRHRV